ncbi:MAG: non-ribosomal peptide synthetase [Taibaiella sp.]|nr:non-ribosomal peptide synthetase [Taibaiella sp.]
MNSRAMEIAERIILNCEKHKDKIAVTFKGKSITYADLGNRARLIAANLQQRHVTGQCVAIETDDLIKHITAICGIIFSGNYYLSLTEDNKWYINENFPVSIACTLVTEPPDSDQKTTINLATLQDNLVYTPVGFNDDDDFCLLITSGTSGTPKIIIHRHKNINVDITGQINNNHITHADNIDLLFSLTFSASVSCVFTALASGARLCVYSVSQQGISGLVAFWAQSEVTYSTISVSVFVAIGKLNNNFLHLEKMRCLGLGTEQVTQAAIDLFKEKFSKSTKLKIAYASTETRTIAQGIFLNDEYLTCNGSVGTPVAGKTVRIISDHGQELPEGEIGEIVVESAAIATGYTGGTELQNQAFSSGGHHSTFYKTGDLGCLAENGQLFIKGRKSAEVKINGMKIDLHLTEDVLSQNPQFTRVAVVVNDTKGKKALVAFFQSETPEIDVAAINAGIPGKLPANHYPNYFSRLPALPLTHTGKIDREKLEHLSFEPLQGKELANNGACNIIEEEIIHVFTKVLNTTGAGKNTSFYTDLGGDSLLSMVAITEIQNRLHLQLPVYAIWIHQRPGQLAEYINFGLHNHRFHYHYINPRSEQKRNFYFINRFRGANDYKFLINSQLAERFNLIHLLFNLEGIEQIEPAETVLRELGELITKQNKNGGAILLGLSFHGFVAQQIAAMFPAVKDCILLDTYNYFEIQTYAQKRNKLLTLAIVLKNAARAYDRQLLANYLGPRLSKLINQARPHTPLEQPSPYRQNKKHSFWQQYYLKAAEEGKAVLQANCLFFRATRTFETHPTHGYNWKKHVNGQFNLFNVKCGHTLITGEIPSKIMVNKIMQVIKY